MSTCLTVLFTSVRNHLSVTIAPQLFTLWVNILHPEVQLLTGKSINVSFLNVGATVYIYITDLVVFTLKTILLFTYHQLEAETLEVTWSNSDVNNIHSNSYINFGGIRYCRILFIVLIDVGLSYPIFTPLPLLRSKLPITIQQR